MAIYVLTNIIKTLITFIDVLNEYIFLVFMIYMRRDAVYIYNIGINILGFYLLFKGCQVKVGK